MLSWVIKAFHQSHLFNTIIVVGSKSLDKLPEINLVTHRIFQGYSLIQNLLHGILFLKIFIHKMANQYRGYVVSFCDAPLLTPEIITHTMHTITNSDADIVIHYVEDKTILNSQLSLSKRSYLTVGNKNYTGSNIYYIKTLRVLWKCLPYLREIRKIRKNPNKIYEILGCDNRSFSHIEKHINTLLGFKIQLLVSPYVEMGVDVDNSDDFEIVKNYLTLQKHPKTPHIEKKPPQKNLFQSYKGILRIFIWISVIILLGTLSQLYDIKEFYLNSLTWIDGNTILAPIFYLGFYIILSGILIPSLILKISAGFLFGFTKGILLVTLASTISSSIKFFLARYWFRDFIMEKFKKNSKWQAINLIFQKKRWKLLLLLRNIPIVSSLFLNYICGLSTMPVRHFIYTSSIGRLPSIMLYVYLGCITEDIFNINESHTTYIAIKWIILFIGILAAVGVTFYCKHLLKTDKIELQKLSQC